MPDTETVIKYALYTISAFITLWVFKILLGL